VWDYISTLPQAVIQPFLEKQTKLCFQASEQAARLATTSDQGQWKKSWEEFWMLYWGPLAIVEDIPGSSIYAEVAPSMIKFGDKINEIGYQPTTLPANDLTGTAIQISKACQHLVTSWWAIGISSLFTPSSHQ
jgi:hypothetical protein